VEALLYQIPSATVANLSVFPVYLQSRIQ